MSVRVLIRIRIRLLTVELLLACAFFHAQTASETRTSNLILLKAGRFLDVKTGHYVEAAWILIEGDRIKEIARATDMDARVPKGATALDLD